MRLINFSLRILSLTLLLMPVVVIAQVTIGSTMPPVSGALLDLKEEDAATPGGKTSTKGLGMPRVELSDAAKLKMGPDLELMGSQRAAHTGLIVYNMHEDMCLVTPLYKGMYVWDGGQWQYLGQKEESSSPDVFYESDTRPQLLGNQRYPYRSFGTAGDWMLENMRYLPTAADLVQLIAKAGDSNYDSTDKFYTYPNGDPANPATAPTTWSAQQGLLYSYSAATLGEQDTVNKDQGQGSATEGPATPIKGVCPAGWHIPSDREWNELEQELYNHAGDYSTYTAAELSNIGIWNPNSSPNAWQTAWNTQGGYRGSTGSGGHGLAIQSICNVPGTGSATGGKSFSTALGGFNALLTGGASSGSVYFFGDNGLFWSTSAYGNGGAWGRTVTSGISQVFRGVTGRYDLSSVRCKK